ncbi:DnaJ homolog subfamily C member 9 [Eumeta japonica]|uniref:DnaJ homolog subfamily C member 9 n=1 Tax=Eumeta variegata TaxID=151549 RepID=A0A4C1WC23_EUMVA|nr:DnaJ homolog subfamily C member 9 [Eumeta japonica]
MAKRFKQKKTCNRKEILQITTNFYRNLYCSENHVTIQTVLGDIITQIQNVDEAEILTKNRFYVNPKNDISSFYVPAGEGHGQNDNNKRTVYDETGVVDEESEIVSRDWETYWRLLFKKITDEDIREYEEKYIGSEEELQDLKIAYLDGKGDMDYICDHVLYTCAQQEPRIKEILNNLIEKGEIPSYKIFTNEPEKKIKRRHAKERKEAAEAEKLKNESRKENGVDLALLIKQKQQSRARLMDSFLDDLATKYGGTESASPKPKSSKRKAPQETEQVKKRKTKK